MVKGIAREGLVVGGLFALIALYALRPLWDIDVFWHVVAGRLIAEQGLDVARDTFSAIDPDRPWIPLVWGYHLLTYGIDQLGGLSALRLVHAAVQIAAFGLFYFVCRRRLGFGFLASTALLLLLVVLYADRFRARPHVFNLLFEIALLPIFVRGAASFSRKDYLFTAGIFSIWANLHGGGAFVLLCAAAAIPAAAVVTFFLHVPGREGELKKAFLWYAFALLPALISPLFVRSIVHTFGMVAASEVYTFEWHPAFRLFLVGKIPAHYFAAAFPFALALALVGPVAQLLSTAAQEGRPGLRTRLREQNLHALIFAVLLLYLSHRSIRFIYLSTFALIFVLPTLRRTYTGFELSERARRGLLIVASVLLVLMSYQSRITHLYQNLPRALGTVFGKSPILEDRFPVKQADFLAATHFEGRIFCQAMWGGYLLYRLWPAVFVTADGRGNHDASLTQDLMTISNQQNMAAPELGPKILEIYDRYPIDLIVHHHRVWPAGYRPPPEWVLVQEDPIGQIWVRNRGAGSKYLAHLASLGVVRTSTVPR